MFRHGLIRENTATITMIARVLDVVCVLGGGLVAYLWRFGHLELKPIYTIALLVSVLLTLLLFSHSGIYRTLRGKSWFHQARIISVTWLSIVVTLIIIAFVTKTSGTSGGYSRQWATLWTFTTWALLLSFRLSLYSVLRVMRAKGWNHRHIVIVGVGELGRSVARNLKDAAWTGLDIVAFIDDSGKSQQSYIEGIEVKKGIDALCDIVEQRVVQEVWLALPLREEDRMQEILQRLRHNTVMIRFVPGIFGFRLLNHSISEVAGLPVIDLNASPMLGLNRIVKAVEDRTLALLILILICPILISIAIGIKWNSPGPVLFKQRRHGWDGKTINVYKFRTMVVHNEANNSITQAAKDDSRITRFGRFLRHTSLDELPQFFNVLQGKMSIVGPRPHAVAHNEQYKEQIDTYMQRHNVKPGITGWAQIHGWRGETDTLEKMKKRVEYDLYYIENWSLWLDLKIIAVTLVSGFIHKNAY